MTTIFWKNSLGGDWQTPSNWSTGSVPNGGDDAVINATGSYTVTSATSTTVHSISSAATATLLISQGTLTATTGSGSSAVAGKITVAGGAALAFGGTLRHSGTIALNGASLLVASGADVLTGGGKVVLSNFSNLIGASASGASLTNVNNTISGAGQIGQNDGQLTLSNASTIDATGTMALLLETGNAVSNTGLLEATGSGGLKITDTVNNAGGTIKAAGAGAHVDIKGSVVGGTLATSAGGVINVSSSFGQTFDGSSAGRPPLPSSR